MVLHKDVSNTKIKNTFKTIEERFHKVHNHKYSYEHSVFKGVDHKIIVTCPTHGNWEILPTNHLAGCGCLLCYQESLPKGTDKFIEDAKRTHGNKFDYSKVEYINTHSKVELTCNTCGYSFKQNAKSHILGSGCPSCSNNQRYTTEEFIEKSNKIHSNFYNYSKTIYKSSHTKVIITCPEHGDFEQGAGYHLHGQGCPICRPGGFDKTKPGRLYYLKVTIDNMVHYKIGITNGTVRSRFRSISDRSKIEVVKQKLYKNGEDALKWENFFKKRYKEYQYKGPKFFTNSGDTEVFTEDILKLFYKELNNNEIDSKTLPT